MELNVMIEDKFSQYLCNEISKENLQKWAIDDMDDFYCDELVRRFNRILSGKENASFTFAFQIPKKFVMNDLLQIKNIWC